MGITHRSRKFSLLSLFLFFSCLLTISECAFRARAVQAREGPNPPAPQVSPAPQSSPTPLSLRKPRTAGTTLRRIFDFLKCNAAKQTKEQELFQTGMQFPANYDAGEFSIIALVKKDWAVNFEYELEPGATATITFTVKDIAPFSQSLPPSVIGPSQTNLPPGGPQISAFRLPERFGPKPQAALISFRATTVASNGTLPANLKIYAIGIGDRAPKPTSTGQPARQTDVMNAVQVKMSYPDFQPLYDLGSSPMLAHRTYDVSPQAVRIEAVNVTPGLIPIKQGGEFDYTFVSDDKFGAWRADYWRNIEVVRKGKTIQGTHRVRGEWFNELVIAGLNPIPPKSKKWKIKRLGSTPPGEYKIQVTAHLAANAGSEAGKAATRFSDPVKID